MKNIPIQVAIQLLSSNSVAIPSVTVLFFSMNGVVTIDTHQAFNSSNGVYTAPISGIYKVAAVSEGTNFNTSHIISLNAGDTYMTDLPPRPEIGDYVILNYESLVEIIESCAGKEIKARILDDVNKSRIGNIMHDLYVKDINIVPKDTSLHTYRLLYGKG